VISNSLLLAAAASSTLLNGLVGYWPLDGNGNDALGVSNGTVQGTGSSWSTGKLGSAFHTGGSARVNLGGAAQIKPTENMTIGGWFWFNGSAPNGRLCSDWHQDGSKDRWIFPYSFGSSSIFLHMGVNISLGVVGGSIPVASWVHLLATVAGPSGGNVASTYVNAGFVSSAGQGTLTRTGAGNVCLGLQEEGGGGMDGRIDEFAMWNRVLTAGEIAEWYNAGSGKTHPFV